MNKKEKNEEEIRGYRLFSPQRMFFPTLLLLGNACTTDEKVADRLIEKKKKNPCVAGNVTTRRSKKKAASLARTHTTILKKYLISDLSVAGSWAINKLSPEKKKRLNPGH